MRRDEKSGWFKYKSQSKGGIEEEAGCCLTGVCSLNSDLADKCSVGPGTEE